MQEELDSQKITYMRLVPKLPHIMVLKTGSSRFDVFNMTKNSTLAQNGYDEMVGDNIFEESALDTGSWNLFGFLLLNQSKLLNVFAYCAWALLKLLWVLTKIL